MGMWAGLIAYCRRGFYPAALWVGHLSSASHPEIPLVVSLSNHFCSNLTTARSFDGSDKSRLSTLVGARVERVGGRNGSLRTVIPAPVGIYKLIAGFILSHFVVSLSDCGLYLDQSTSPQT